MKISQRIIMIISSVIIVYTLVMSCVLFFYLSYQLTRIEYKNTSDDLSRAEMAVDRECDAVATYCLDYSRWDDTYNFIIYKNMNYVLANYDPQYLKEQRINIVSIFNNEGKILYSITCDPETNLNVDFSDLNITTSPIAKLIRNGIDHPDSIIKGMIMTSRGFCLIASYPVMDSKASLPSRGRFIAGRFFTKKEIENIRNMFKVDVYIHDIHLNNPFHKKIHKSEDDDRFFVKTSDIITGYKRIRDAMGSDVALLELRYPRNITRQGIYTLFFVVILLGGFGIIILLVSISIMKRGIVSPLQLITNRSSEIGRTGDFTGRLPEFKMDEFAILSGSFNTLLDRLSDVNATLESRVAQRTEALEVSNRELLLMAEVFRHSLDGIIITDAEVRIINVNPAFTRITGFLPEDVMGHHPGFLKSDRHERAFYMEMWDTIRNTGYWSGEMWNRHKTGRVYPEWMSVSAIKDSNGNVSNFMGVFHDISDSKQQEMFIRYQAFHDALTGLPNRLLLLDRMSKTIVRASRNHTRFGILFIDLDNFKTINDTLGHDYGDLLLQHTAERLVKLVRNTDTVSRLGGDEFLIMIDEMSQENHPAILAERIINAFRDPFIIKDQIFHVGTSIGIALYPEDGIDAGVLIRNADTAMYRAKEEGRHTFMHFTTSLNERVTKRFKLETDLRMAIQLNQFEVHYQPKMNIKSGSIVGSEGLIRWRNFDSLVSPIEFIPLAEETGLIVSLDRMVFEMACNEIGSLNRNRDIPLNVALNCSAKELHSKNYMDGIEEIIERSGMKPEWIEIEITETELMKDLETSLAILKWIADRGMSIALDDFGTGYSSLGQLTRLPINTLKIDRSFIMKIGTCNHSVNIIETIIAMAQKLNLKVVAEGVETMEQMEYLRKVDCDLIQGYLVSRPLPFPRYVDFLNGPVSLIQNESKPSLQAIN